MTAAPSEVLERIPFEVTYHGMEASPVAEEQILAGMERLERLNAKVLHANVALARRAVRSAAAGIYEVKIRLSVPGPDIHVSRTPPAHVESENLVTAIGEAFERARRSIIEQREIVRGEVKAHGAVTRGEVTDVFPDHGFIRGEDGRIVYFHRNSVLQDDWNAVEVGSHVRFADEPGEEGPHATAVTLLSRAGTPD